MGWHPDWYYCKDCGLVYLEYHPLPCSCGSNNFGSIHSEDVFTLNGWDDPCLCEKCHALEEE